MKQQYIQSAKHKSHKLQSQKPQRLAGLRGLKSLKRKSRNRKILQLKGAAIFKSCIAYHLFKQNKNKIYNQSL